VNRSPIPQVNRDPLVREALVVLLTPISLADVASAQVRSNEAFAEDGLIILRPHLPLEGPPGEARTPTTTHSTRRHLELRNPLYLGRRGRILGAGRNVMPCTFTQTVTAHPSFPSIFDIAYKSPPGSSGPGSLDIGGVDVSVFWQFQPAPPPFPRLGNLDWPASLSQEAINALCNIPRSFYRELNPPPIHGTDIAGK
jgi:hypothetical protein